MKINPTKLFALLALATASNCTIGADDALVAKLASQTCSSCHGPGGDSVSPAFPRLAGQRMEYLEAQLKAFRDKTRGDPMAQAYMWGMTSQLDDGTIRKLAVYYSTYKPPRGKPGSATLVATGKSIFEQGIPGSNIPACASCHGKDAEGSAAAPRLAGQHAEYLVKQLALFKSAMRAGANAEIMHGISAGMSFDQMEAVAAYAASK